MTLQTPSVLAQLPKPLGITDGQTRFSQVHGLVNARKRKRHELAVAVDGESINVYNVQSGKLKTSYAVPPQSSFTCDPCSVSYTTSDGIPVRKTFCSLSTPEASIWVFSEKQDGPGRVHRFTSKWAVNDCTSPIIHLDTISRENEEQQAEPDLLVLHTNGQMRRISSYPHRQLWSLSLHTSTSAQGINQQLIAASAIMCPLSELNMFKDRPDIVSDLEALFQEDSESVKLLLCVNRETSHEDTSRQNIYFEVHALPHSLKHGFGIKNAATKRLLRNGFPKDHDRWSSKPTTRISIDSTNGVVDVAFERGIVSYNLIGYSANILSELVLDSETFSSVMRLSSSLTVAASSSAITLYDAKYYSILYRIPMDQVRLNRKRKRTTGQVMEEPIKFIGFFRHLGTLVALRGNSLLSFEIQLDQSSHETYRNPRQDGLLIGAIGKGLSHHVKQDMKKPRDLGPGFGSVVTYRNQSNTEQWVARMHYLDGLIDAAATQDFEQEVALDIFGTTAQERTPAKLYQSKKSACIDPQKVRYALSKIFFLAPADQELEEVASLQLRPGAPLLLQWLISHQWISLASINAVLNEFGRDATQKVVPPGSICKAFAGADPSLCLLVELLEHARSLDTSELIFVVQQHVVEAFNVENESAQNNLLAGPQHEESPFDKSNLGRFEPNPKSRAKAISSLEDQSTIRRSIVLKALGRLQSRPKGELISDFRSYLRGDSLLALIQVLRQQLFHGGHTMSFRSQPLLSTQASPTANGQINGLDEQPNLGLDVIIHLLSCCIDALGPASVLSGSVEKTFMEPLITDLRSEISSALQGVEEATYLQGILREVWRYGATATNKTTETDDTTLPGSQRQPIPGEILTLVSQSSENQFDTAAAAGMLPLSLKVENSVSEYKVRRGGGQILQRSQREKAGLHHRAVGKYSFERLTL